MIQDPRPTNAPGAHRNGPRIASRRQGATNPQGEGCSRREGPSCAPGGNARILGLDPGSERSAWALWEPATGLLVDCAWEPNADLLWRLQQWVDPRPTLVIERIQPYRLAQPVMDTLWWSGRFFQVFTNPQEPAGCQELTYRNVSLELTGRVSAREEEVRDVVRSLYPHLAEVLKRHGARARTHIWSAIAVAEAWRRRGGER